MKKNIILAGVGGQGILSIAAVLDFAAVDLELNIKQAEVHGMSQRGGAVQSHLRISDEQIYSDLIPLGGADLILSLDPLESLRYVSYLAADGWIVSSSNSYKNIKNYPSDVELLNSLNMFSRKIMVDAESLAKDVGNVKAVNMIMLGAAAFLINLSMESLEKGIEALFGQKGNEVVDMNKQALHLGLKKAGELNRIV